MTTATIENKATTDVAPEPVVPATDAPSSVPTDSPELQPLETVPGSLPDLELPVSAPTISVEESYSDSEVERRLEELAAQTQVLMLKLGKDLEWTRTDEPHGAIVFSNAVEGNSENGEYSITISLNGLSFVYLDDSLCNSTFIKYVICEEEVGDNPCAGKVGKICVTSTFFRGMTNHRQFSNALSSEIESQRGRDNREEHMNKLLKAIFEAGFEMGNTAREEDSPLDDILNRVLSGRGSGRAQVKTFIL